MHKVLFVDDDPSTIASIVKKLRAYSDQFEIVTARNGREALLQITQGQIDMVVTDLRMPEMDGFELLTHINNDYPNIPAVVITAFNNQKVEIHLAEAHQVKVIEKPIDYDVLVASIQRTLKTLADKCAIKGISLSNFLQLIQWEGKSCLIEITDGRGESGFFYAEEGELHDAVFGLQTGEEAAYTMLAVDDPKITIHPLSQRKTEKRIHQDLMSILMEGMRLNDERDSPPPPATDVTLDDIFPDGVESVSSCIRESLDGDGLTVLVVDDSKVMRNAITSYLRRCEGIGAVMEAENGRDAIVMNENFQPDIITMDVLMPVMDGLEALKHIMIRQPTPVIMVSALTRDGAWETFEALRLGAVDFIDKPNRMASTDIDRQLARLESKILSAHRSNRKELKLLRRPVCEPSANPLHPLQSEHRVLVAAAAEGGYRALLSILLGMDLQPTEGFLATLKADATHLDAFADYLESFSPVPVIRAHRGETLQAGVCHLTSAQERLALERQGNTIAFTTTEAKEVSHQKAADLLMASVADTFGKTAAGLILCGNNGDGLEGLRKIKAAGGTTFATSPDCTLFPEAVRLAVQSNLVDRVLSRSLSDLLREVWGD